MGIYSSAIYWIMQNHPLLCRQRKGELIRLNTTSYQIGILPDIEHNAFEESREPGDWLFMCSDVSWKLRTNIVINSVMTG